MLNSQDLQSCSLQGDEFCASLYPRVALVSHQKGWWWPLTFVVIAAGSAALPNVISIPLLSCLPALLCHQPGQNLSQNDTSDPRLKGFILWVLLVLSHEIHPEDLVGDQTFAYLLNTTILKEKSWNGMGGGALFVLKMESEIRSDISTSTPYRRGNPGSWGVWASKASFVWEWLI